jgi:hypothetical protein
MSDLIAGLVEFCVRRAWAAAALILALVGAAIFYDLDHFAMTTDTDQLLSPKLSFRRLEARFDKAFPDASSDIVAVVDATTPELAEAAADKLMAALQAEPNLFRRVWRPDASAFFKENGLLFLSLSEVRDATSQMITAQPFLGPVAADPSLRGIMQGLSIALTGVESGAATLDDLHAPIRALADALDGLATDRPAFVSWRTLISKRPPAPRDLRRIILIDPSLDYARLQPGAAASQTIRASARALGLDAAHGIRLRLTGPIALADEEFGTLAEHVGLIASLMGAAIVLMLWLATKSARAIACILMTTVSGLALAAALGLALFGQFNVISVAFIPLFVGLGIDFSIQFAVRFRAEQRSAGSIQVALAGAGRAMGRSLLLAASAISVGFLAFLPTQYLGVSQLGAIAGCGLMLALALSLTLLPALLRIVGAGGHLSEAGAPALTAIDGAVLGHRRLTLGIAGAAALVCIALMPFVRFDFNPLHLRSTKTESVSTLLDLMGDKDETPNTIDVLASSLEAAKVLAKKLAVLPEVSHTMTLADLTPGDQGEKLALVEDAAFLLDPTLNPIAPAPAPDDAEIIASIRSTAEALENAADHSPQSPAAADARRLAQDLARLADAQSSARTSAASALIPGLALVLDQMRSALRARAVAPDTLPSDLVRQWVAADGRARISVSPKGDSNDNRVLQRFARAVRAIAPDATGVPISIQASADVIVGAFADAGALSFIAITALLFVALRRTKDVIITMTPIVLTGLLTLGSCVVIGQPLNFANIIALPLLFGIGVAFHIYFVMAWRAGNAHLLQSSLARAVFFSALTTATGFGSLWLSSHPGTSSMGKLLMISLIWTLVSALLFQPALMGPPRTQAGHP